MSGAPIGAPVPVVAAVIRRNDRYLVALRPDDKRHGGRWEFPGGKVLDGETPSEALDRELREELGVSVTSVGRSLFEARDPGSPFVVRFLAATVAGEPRAGEHAEIRWAAPDELRRLSLCPSDRAFVREHLGKDAAER